MSDGRAAPPVRRGELVEASWLGAFVLVAAIGFAYAGTHDAPYVLDDRVVIIGSRSTPLGEILRSNPTRALSNLTFYLNRRIFGEHLAAYHAVNVAIHAVNAILLFALLRCLRRLSAPWLPAWAPLGAALVWALHPLQTNAVTYLTQRIASLAALCYLGATLCYLRGRESRAAGSPPASGASLRWYCGAIGFATAGVFTKENTATLPATLFITEWLILGDLAPLSRRVRALLLALFLVALPGFYIAYYLVHVTGPSGPPIPGLVPYGYAYQGFDFPTRRDYLLTEPGVVLRYLRLWLIPVNQVFDPLILPVKRVLDPRFLLPAAALLALALAALSQARRRPLVAFGLLWFFATISIESSVFPLVDFYFEHRMLLPSVGLVVAFLGGAGPLLSRRPRAGFVPGVALAVLLGAGTIARNQVWDNAILFWQDNVTKAPGKLRGWTHLADAYVMADRLELAEQALLRARAIYDRNADVYYNLGVVYLRRGDMGKAEESLRHAIKLSWFYVEAHYNLGVLLAQTGREREAEGEFGWVLWVGKIYVPEAHYNLGVLYAKQGRGRDAVRELEAAVRGRPDLLEAQHNLAVEYRKLGRAADAARVEAMVERLRRQRPAP